MKEQYTPFSWKDILWDLWCVSSVVGIWPRFIEPNRLAATPLDVAIPDLPKPLHNWRVVHLTDLHLNPRMSTRFLSKVVRKVQAFDPHIVVFSGDFLCYATMPDFNRLRDFLCALKARVGNFASLGNHDYERYVSINKKGDYDICCGNCNVVAAGIKRICCKTQPTGITTDQCKELAGHPQLLALFRETPFTLLHNATETIAVGNSGINVSGLGDYMAGQCDATKAFENYKSDYPGIVLSHNPDSLPLLEECPGDIILCGHAHGGAVNLPWIWSRVTALENLDYTKGSVELDDKIAYINRGLGGTFCFRWRATPELLCMTLKMQPTRN